jgi:hypothetical protein
MNGAGAKTRPAEDNVHADDERPNKKVKVGDAANADVVLDEDEEPAPMEDATAAGASDLYLDTVCIAIC